MFITFHRFITRLCKKGHAQLAENDKKMEARSISEFSVRTWAYVLFPRLLSVLIRPHCRPYLGKDLRHERLEMCFLRLKSVRSCALILKPNSVRWWERAHLCVRARVCVCAHRGGTLPCAIQRAENCKRATM